MKECRYCGSTDLEELQPLFKHPQVRCRSCKHLHIGQWLYHDRDCCDRTSRPAADAPTRNPRPFVPKDEAE